MLGLKALHLAPQYGVAVPKLVLVRLETHGEEAETELKKLVVVSAIEHWVLDVADQVLKERADDNVDDLANLDVHALLQVGLLVELLKLNCARDVFLSTRLVQLVKGRIREIRLVDILVEVKRHVVHQKRLELFLKPHDALVSLHVDVECAEYALLLGVDVWDQLKGLHVDRNADPVAKFSVNILLFDIVVRLAANLHQVEHEVGL